MEFFGQCIEIGLEVLLDGEVVLLFGEVILVEDLVLVSEDLILSDAVVEFFLQFKQVFLGHD